MSCNNELSDACQTIGKILFRIGDFRLYETKDFSDLDNFSLNLQKKVYCP